MKFFERIERKCIVGIEKINMLLLIFMIVITFTQVVLRYVFNSPLSWAAEITVISLMWFGYLGLTIVKQEDNHIAIDFLYNKLPPVIQSLLDIFKEICFIAFGICMVYYGYFLYSKLGKSILPATGVSRAVMYATLIVSGVLMTFFASLQLIRDLKGFRKGHDKQDGNQQGVVS